MIMGKQNNYSYAGRSGLNLTVFISFLLAVFLITGCAEQEKEQTSAENTKEMTIPVEGMSCNSCVANIKRTLKPVEGIEKVSVSLEHRNATIGYDPEQVTAEQVQQAINDLGYKAGEPITKKEEKQ